MKKIILSIAICFILLALFDSCAVYAYRPLSTEDTGVPEQGALELESGFTYTREASAGNNFNFVLVPVYGLLENSNPDLDLFSCNFPPDNALHHPA